MPCETQCMYMAVKYPEGRSLRGKVKASRSRKCARFPHSKMYTKPIFHCDAKPFAFGPRVGLELQRHNFALEIPTCCYLKMLKFALFPTPTPNVSRWNIGGVGCPTQDTGVGHVHFIFLCWFHLRWVANANRVSSGICALLLWIKFAFYFLLHQLHIHYKSQPIW